jgi:uncharacterized membrane protein YqhA
MMFQFGGATGVLQMLQNWGIIDGLLPFLLIFTLMFAILVKTGIFKESRKIAGVISATIAALIVIPHMIGGVYPAGYDPINIINQMLPSAGILLVAILLVLMMIGLVGGATDKKSGWMTWIVTIAIGLLLLTIISAIWPSVPILNYFVADASLLALLIVILVFGLIVWFVTKDDTKKPSDKTKALAELIWGK